MKKQFEKKSLHKWEKFIFWGKKWESQKNEPTFAKDSAQSYLKLGTKKNFIIFYTNLQT